MGMLWRRFNFNARAVGAELVNPGEPGQPITLPAITVTLAVPSLDYQAAQGTLVASLPPVPAGATRTIAGDSRLALNGGKDLQVAAKPNLTAIKAACPHADCRELPGLNHLFQPCKTGGLTEYAEIETTLDPSLLEAVAGWVAKQ